MGGPQGRQRVTYIGCRPVPLKEAIGKIPSFLSRTVAERAGPAARAGLDGPKLDLAPPIERVTDESPVEQVCRRVDCASREVLKGRGAQEICRGRIAGGRDNADGRVRVEAAEDWVAEGERVRGAG